MWQRVARLMEALRLYRFAEPARRWGTRSKLAITDKSDAHESARLICKRAVNPVGGPVYRVADAPRSLKPREG